MTPIGPHSRTTFLRLVLLRSNPLRSNLSRALATLRGVFGRSIFTNEQASQIAEFAVSLPLLVVMVVGIFDFSGAFALKQKVANAAREGARAAAADPANDLSGAASGVPVSVSDAYQVVDNYLQSEKINDCGFNCSSAHARQRPYLECHLHGHLPRKRDYVFYQPRLRNPADSCRDLDQHGGHLCDHHLSVCLAVHLCEYSDGQDDHGTELAYNHGCGLQRELRSYEAIPYFASCSLRASHVTRGRTRRHHRAGGGGHGRDHGDGGSFNRCGEGF